jgi:endoglucanase
MAPVDMMGVERPAATPDIGAYQQTAPAQCGSANQQDISQTPATGLCVTGTASVVAYSAGTWSWTCGLEPCAGMITATGNNTSQWLWTCMPAGKTAQCAAYMMINGQVGSDKGASMNSLTVADPALCAAGSVTGFATTATGWAWGCAGTRGGSNDMSGFANLIVNGRVGTDKGMSLNSLTAADSHLCAAGTVTNFVATATGWTWGCAGISGGSADMMGFATLSTPVAPVLPYLSYLGVNISGAEFGSGTLPGALGKNYVFPSHAELAYDASKHLNIIRLPFLWERLQPVMGGALNPAYLSQIDDVVTYGASQGLRIILDVQNFGKYYGNLIGSSSVPAAQFASFWGKVAAHYAGNPNVVFGIMNEPNVQTAPQWLAISNAAIAAIRQAGATTQTIFVQGSYWDGGWSWTTSNNAAVIGMGTIDPSNRIVFEVHQYLDSDDSGTHANVVSTTIGVQRLTAITQWAQKNGKKLFLGEIGVASDPTSLTALTNTLAYIRQNNNVWTGATYWSTGPWWGNYMYSAEPANGVDKPQMTLLSQNANLGVVVAAVKK